MRYPMALMALALLALGSVAHAESVSECLEETGACDVFKNEGNMNTACLHALHVCEEREGAADREEAAEEASKEAAEESETER